MSVAEGVSASDRAHSNPAFQNYRQGAAAVALRVAGASYADISEALGLSGARMAQTMVEADLANRVSDADRKVLREEESARLERLLRGVWQKATDPAHIEHLQAAKVALAIIDRHTRLHGLDAPAEIVVHTPTMSEIDEWVAAMSGSAISDLAALEAPVVIDTEEAQQPSPSLTPPAPA
jgi:hypothetical protein